jgi:hypothetical protein
MLNLEMYSDSNVCAASMVRVRDKKTGKFCVPWPEPISKRQIGVRLPESMDSAVRELAGDDLSNWVRQAIAEKLEREQQMSA